MISSLIEFAMRNRALVIALYLGLAGWGYWALLATPIAAIPDLSDNQSSSSRTGRGVRRRR